MCIRWRCPQPTLPSTRNIAAANTAPQVLRGTDIELSKADSIFAEFLMTFRSLEDSKARAEKRERKEAAERGEEVTGMDPVVDDSAPLHYVSLLQTLHDTQSAALNLDCSHLYYHSPESRRLYDWLCSYPQEIVVRMDAITRSVFEHIHGETDLPLQVRPNHLKTVSHMRALSPAR